MNDQYPKLVVDSRLARTQLAQEFESGVCAETGRRFPPVTDRSLATALEKNVGEGNAPCRDLVSSITSFVRRPKGGKLVKPSSTAKRDISGFGFVLILMLLCEIAAAQTDNPVFWLLVGPTPLAFGFTANRLLRYRSTRTGS